MMHRIECQCGALGGYIQGAGTCSRVVCYCSDCRVFEKFLGCHNDVLDAHGGTEIVQLAQPCVSAVSIVTLNCLMSLGSLS